MMKPKPPIVRELDQSLYTRISGEIRKNLPGKVMVDIERGRNAEGRKIVFIRCRQPEVAAKVIAEVLGEEYIESEPTDNTPVKHKDWWQRSIASGMGGGWGSEVRATGGLKRNWNDFTRQFRSGVLEKRKEMHAGAEEFGRNTAGDTVERARNSRYGIGNKR